MSLIVIRALTHTSIRSAYYTCIILYSVHIYDYVVHNTHTHTIKLFAHLFLTCLRHGVIIVISTGVHYYMRRPLTKYHIHQIFRYICCIAFVGPHICIIFVQKLICGLLLWHTHTHTSYIYKYICLARCAPFIDVIL